MFGVKEMFRQMVARQEGFALLSSKLFGEPAVMWVLGVVVLRLLLVRSTHYSV